MGRKVNVKAAFIIAAWFGAFQALMPTLGYLLATTFRHAITAIDHWVALSLLGFIGAKMIWEALHASTEEDSSLDIGFKTMLLLAVATSVDALAVGIPLAFLDVSIIAAAAIIGMTTFCFSLLGVKLGGIFGARFEKPAELIGGLILIGMGVKILLEHMGHIF